MSRHLVLIGILLLVGTSLHAQERAANGCRIVEQDPAAASGSSVSVTAGGGKASAHTTGSGSSVTVHSGDGTSSSVATASSSGGTTVVAGSGSGDCVITVPKGQKESVK